MWPGGEGIFLGAMVAAYHAVSCHVVHQLKGVVNPEIWGSTLYVHGGLAVLLVAFCLLEFWRVCFLSSESAATTCSTSKKEN